MVGFGVRNSMKGKLGVATTLQPVDEATRQIINQV